ncbi:MAG: hypothetical protein AAGK97_15460, partial [Bacteroidota bacterium]
MNPRLIFILFAFMTIFTSCHKDVEERNETLLLNRPPEFGDGGIAGMIIDQTGTPIHDPSTIFINGEAIQNDNYAFFYTEQTGMNTLGEQISFTNSNYPSKNLELTIFPIANDIHYFRLPVQTDLVETTFDDSEQVNLDLQNGSN